jgi:hypothetical protein
MPLAVTDFTREAQGILRDGSTFEWSTVVLLAFVFYVYSVEVERRRYDIVLAGLAFWLMDWFNEVVNSLVLHFSDRAALWTVTGDTSYLILIGLTIEISFLFAVNGVIFVKFLPEGGSRWPYIIGFSALAVLVEVLLHETGYFHWEYPFWDVPWGLPLILVFGYATFYWVAAKVYDMGDDRPRQIRWVGTLAAIDAAAILLFGPVLGWI